MSNLALALQITALGMGIVFAAIILIWWMMALLTKFTAEKELPVSEPETVYQSEGDERAQAAAIAVVIAMAEHQLSQTHPLPTPPTTIVSAWQLGMRTRQLSEKGAPIVRNPRKIGK